MTTKHELARDIAADHIGKIGTVTFTPDEGQFVLSVEVVDIRRTPAGSIHYLVSVRDASDDNPGASCGQCWIAAERFTEREPTEAERLAFFKAHPTTIGSAARGYSKRYDQ